MKKLKLSLFTIKHVEILTREQLKKVMGGSSDGSGVGLCKSGTCSLAVQGSDGGWVTREGTCKYAMPLDVGGTCYCETGLGMVPVTSNGGVSRCNP